MSNKDDFGITPAALGALLDGDMENFIAASTPGGIEAQEARGQQDFVASETLPTECPREQLESLGFVFGEAADDIFTYVQLPEGWKKVPTEHSMWSDLVDDKDRRRGGIFYKAAFYDRHAHMNLDRKISCGQNYDVKEHVQYQVLSAGEVIYETQPIACEQYSDEYWNIVKAEETKARKWMNENYPDYNDPLAYWD